MIRGPAGRRRVDAIEPQVAQFQRIDEYIYRSNRIVLVDPIIKALRQQRRLLAIYPLNETSHHFPRDSAGKSYHRRGFSHSLDPNRTFRALCPAAPCAQLSVALERPE